jgi:hypothetical protein
MADEVNGVGEVVARAPRLEECQHLIDKHADTYCALPVGHAGEHSIEAARAPQLEPWMLAIYERWRTVGLSTDWADVAELRRWYLDDVHALLPAKLEEAARAPREPLEPADAIYLSDLAHDHAEQVQAGSESVEHALRTVAVCAYEHGIAVLPRAPEPESALSVLSAIEWIQVRDEGGDFYETCPACFSDKALRGGHVLGCALDAALRAARAGAEAPPLERSTS